MIAAFSPFHYISDNILRQFENALVDDATAPCYEHGRACCLRCGRDTISVELEVQCYSLKLMRQRAKVSPLISFRFVQGVFAHGLLDNDTQVADASCIILPHDVAALYLNVMIGVAMLFRRPLRILNAKCQDVTHHVLSDAQILAIENRCRE